MPLATAVEAHTYLGKLIMPGDAACTAWRVQVSAPRCQQLVMWVHAETYRAGSNIPFSVLSGNPRKLRISGQLSCLAVATSLSGRSPFTRQQTYSS